MNRNRLKTALALLEQVEAEARRSPEGEILGDLAFALKMVVHEFEELKQRLCLPE